MSYYSIHNGFTEQRVFMVTQYTLTPNVTVVDNNLEPNLQTETQFH